MQYFAQNPNFRVIANDPKRGSDLTTTPPAGPKWDGARVMEQYDKDRRSAFIGNLPLSMTEELLRTMTSSCGEVVHVQLYKKLIPGANGKAYHDAFTMQPV